MLLVTESVSSSPVSARDVSDYSPSYNIPFTQDSAVPSGCEISFESAGSPVAMAKVFVTVNNGQEITSAHERELIEQSLVHWCNAGRMKLGG